MSYTGAATTTISASCNRIQGFRNAVSIWDSIANVYGGLQDNSCWYGPSRTREPAGILNSDWKMVVNGDGYYMTSHPDEPDLIIAEYQGGGIQRTDMRTRIGSVVSPSLCRR